MERGEVRWAHVLVGALMLLAAATIGFLPADKGDNSCGGVFNDPVPTDWCADVRSGLTWTVGILAVAGFALVLLGLAGRLRGGRLVLAGALVLGVGVAGVGGMARASRYDRCGSVRMPMEWPESPSPNGRTRPEGCGPVIELRRAQVAALWIATAAMAGALVIVVRRAPDPDALPLDRTPSGASPPAA